MFAKRRAKAQTWDAEQERDSGGGMPVMLTPSQADRPKLVSKLEQQHQVLQAHQQAQDQKRASLTELVRMAEPPARPLSASLGKCLEGGV